MYIYNTNVTTIDYAAAAPEVIICFDSTSHVIMAEQTLLEQGFDVRVMPRPSAIKAGCGFCLRFLPEAIEKAIVSLAKCGIYITPTP
jgi:hypothetical protein